MLHHLISLPSPAVILGLGLISQAVLQQHAQFACRQLAYLAVARAWLPPWAPFFLRQTLNCPSVLNLILN
jgi:hypothetical protein